MFQGKYMMRLGDAKSELTEEVDIDLLHPDMVLLGEPGLCCFLLRCKKIGAEQFMEWVAETVLSPEVRKLTSVIEEKDSALTLLSDDLQDRNNRIQAIQYENVALQAQREVYKAELQRCQDTITNLRKCYVPHAMDSGKDNILIIIRKHATSKNDKYHGLLYYVARIRRRNMYVKLRWFDRHFPDHEVIVEIDNPNSIHAFNRFEEQEHA